MGWFTRKAKEIPQPSRNGSILSTHALDGVRFNAHGFKPMDIAISNAIAIFPEASAEDAAMDDSSDGVIDTKALSSASNTISNAVVDWYASQSFIGHQMCAIIAQHWLVNKACSMPGRDAIRNGYEIATVDGDDLDVDAGKILKKYDKKFKVKENLAEYVRFGRIFGIRISVFKVESTDPDYYEKPFNIDGVTPGSYKGIVQPDPYWCAPYLDVNSAAKPDSLHFYEPTWWIINGKKHHRSHLIIYRHADPADLLKPQYMYGGVPLPQMLMERVYAAERTANEAPQLAQTKRTNVWLTDMERVMADPDKTIERLNQWGYFRDNYSVKLGDKESDQFEQFDVALADFDSIIMTEYQLAAAIAGVPATKLLGTTPKGFNSTGDYEEASYHEELESIQEHELTPLLERHHALVMRSYVVPKLKIEPVETTISWLPLDSPTSKEQADVNLTKAQTGLALMQAGALTAEDERQRLATDKDGGYYVLGLEELKNDDMDLIDE